MLYLSFRLIKRNSLRLSAWAFRPQKVLILWSLSEELSNRKKKCLDFVKPVVWTLQMQVNAETLLVFVMYSSRVIRPILMISLFEFILMRFSFCFFFCFWFLDFMFVAYLSQVLVLTNQRRYPLNSWMFLSYIGNISWPRKFPYPSHLSRRLQPRSSV